jgi:ribosome biogenesis GTPase A
MNKKCVGCGLKLQTEDEKKEGYIKPQNREKSSLCERCFRIQNYNEYQVVDKTNKDFSKIFKKIDKSKDLVLVVVDLLNIGEVESLKKYIHNDVILVLTKRDLVPKQIYEEKLLHYFDKLPLNIIDKIIISSKNNYHLDELMELVMQKKKSKNVYVVGITNAGKSTLINKIIYNYSNLDSKITTSILPSTTLDTIEIPISEDLVFIDTPGLLVPGSIVDKVSPETLRNIIPKTELKPTVFQVKSDQIFLIDQLVRLEVEEDNNIVFYVSNNLTIMRYYKDNDKLTDLKKHELTVNESEDIVIEGLAFIKVMKKAHIVLYTLEGVNVYTRKSFL